MISNPSSTLIPYYVNQATAVANTFHSSGSFVSPPERPLRGTDPTVDLLLTLPPPPKTRYCCSDRGFWLVRGLTCNMSFAKLAVSDLR